MNIHLLFVGHGEPERELRQSCHIVYDAETAGPETPESDGQSRRAGRETRMASP
jgi:hypothetical protein